MNFDKQMIGAVAYLVLFPTLMAFIIQNVAQQLTTSTHTALILCLESVFGTVLSVIFLKEILTIKMIAGCVLIFMAIVLTDFA
jgi:drug/metabolite transporter (DMT)-like permease